jgi:hypothetical protein
MNNVRRSTVIIGAFVALLTLTGCGNDSTKTSAAPSITPSTLTETAPRIIAPITEVDPGTEIPEEEVAEGPGLPAKKVTIPKVDPKHQHERVDKTFSSELPSNFSPPANGTLFKEASVIDGDRSYLAYDYTTPWETVAIELKASLKAEGWVCVNCVEFRTSTPTEINKYWRYTMTMQLDGRELEVLITDYKGAVTANLNFMPAS